MIKDMTEGKPVRLMVGFGLPLVISNILQLVFSIVDGTVVGRILGVMSFASVSATASSNWLLLSTILGIAQGFAVVFAHRFGAKDMPGFRRAFFTSMWLVAGFGILMGLAGVIWSRALLVALGTPAELLDGATAYLSVLTGGIVISFAYNILGSALRALGDSKTPLYAMIFASLLNVVLSIALIYPFALAGVAAASLISNAFASLFCLRVLIKSGVLLRRLSEKETSGVESARYLESSDVLSKTVNNRIKNAFPGWDPDSARELLRIGLPLGMRNLVISLGDLLVQIYINRFGAEFIAAIAMAKRMYVLLLLTGSAVEGSVATFVAQNFGAKRLDRVKMGVRSGLKLVLGGSALTMVVVFLFGRFIMSLMLEGDPAQVGYVLDTATLQLMVLTAGLPMVNILFLYRATLQGLGRPLIPTLTGFVEMAGLMGAVVFLTPIIGEWGVLLSDPVGWVAPATLSLISYYVVMRRLK